jgi:hypothetical protein
VAIREARRRINGGRRRGDERNMTHDTRKQHMGRGEHRSVAADLR